jgi:hypothetical protein
LFDAESKTTQRLSHSVIDVQMESLSKLIADHGVPCYLKIHIEGCELDALRTLTVGTDMPAFLSFEVNAKWEAILSLLGGLDTTSFNWSGKPGATCLRRRFAPERGGA